MLFHISKGQYLQLFENPDVESDTKVMMGGVISFVGDILTPKI